MIATTAILAVVMFVAALWWAGVIGAVSRAMATARHAVASLRDNSLDDRSREKAIQRASLGLMGSVASILLRGLVSFAASLLPIWAAHATGLATFRSVLALLSRWDFILISTGVMVIGYLAKEHSWLSS